MVGIRVVTYKYCGEAEITSHILVLRGTCTSLCIGILTFESAFLEINKKAPKRGFFICGGEAGIRTLGTARFNGFQAPFSMQLQSLTTNFCTNLNTLINVQSHHILSDFGPSVPKLSQAYLVCSGQ